MQCPSCWRPINFEEKYAKAIACPYCNSILEFGGSELTKVWEQWYFIDFPSVFVVWKEVEYLWKKIYIKWQLRFEYDGWFFDKFYAIVDWKEIYIREDDGTIKFSILENTIISDLTLVDKVPWENLNFEGKDLFIQEVWVFKLVNLKWFVKNLLIPWKEYEYLDWIYNWKMYFLERDTKEWKIIINKEI